MTTNVPARKSKFRLVVTILGAVIVIPVVGVGVLLATFDADKYRGEIAQLLTDKLGRKVSLNGPMHLGVMGGLALEINDAAVANPEWASRPEMAKIGKLALSLKLAPLLHKELAIKSIVLNDADVQLETNVGGAKNWEFDFMKSRGPKPVEAPADGKEPAKATDKKMPINLNINEVRLKNVRFAIRDAAKGKDTVVMISSMSLDGAGKTALKLNGAFNQEPFDVTLNGAPWQDLLANKNWPFQADAAFAGNDLTAQGTVGQLGTMVDLASFKLTTVIGSTIDGKLNINVLGKPRINGSLHIDVVKAPAGGGKTAATASSDTPAAAAAPVDKRMFSDARIDLSALKSANADIRIVIDRIEGGPAEIAAFNTNLRLSSGNLEFNPLSVQIAGNPVTGRIGLNAAQEPATMLLALTGHQMDLNPLLHGAGTLGASLGKSDLDIDLHSRGDSPHAFASNMDGKVIVQTGKGTVPLQAFKLFTGNLIRALLPGAEAVNDLNLTCGTIRFQAQNGVLKSNGILLESNLTTVVGAGAVDLGQETINLNLKPQPKDGALGKLAPTVRVAGSLAAPAVKIDAVGAAANIAGQFLGADIPGAAGQQVPVVNPNAPGNPCTDALDHPVYATTNAAPNSAAGKAIEKGRTFVQDKLGKVLGGDKSPLKGLFGQ